MNIDNGKIIGAYIIQKSTDVKIRSAVSSFRYIVDSRILNLSPDQIEINFSKNISENSFQNIKDTALSKEQAAAISALDKIDEGAVNALVATVGVTTGLIGITAASPLAALWAVGAVVGPFLYQLYTLAEERRNDDVLNNRISALESQVPQEK